MVIWDEFEVMFDKFLGYIEKIFWGYVFKNWGYIWQILRLFLKNFENRFDKFLG